MRITVGIMLLFLLSGCAALTAPSPKLIDEKPVVTMGSPAPPDNDYILHVPADREFPVVLSVTGSLFNSEGNADTRVSFKRDLYLYKSWASYDGRHWRQLSKLFGISISAGMSPDGGTVKVGLEEHP